MCGKTSVVDSKRTEMVYLNKTSKKRSCAGWAIITNESFKRAKEKKGKQANTNKKYDRH